MLKFFAGDLSTVQRIVDQLNRTSAQIEADLRCLAGVLALEHGSPKEAAEQFRTALALAASQPGTEFGFPCEPVCRAYLSRLESQARR